MTYFPHPGNHVSLHRLWAFVTTQRGLTRSEHIHVFDCAECIVAVKACVKSDTFGAVLTELDREDDDGERSQSKAG